MRGLVHVQLLFCFSPPLNPNINDSDDGLKETRNREARCVGLQNAITPRLDQVIKPATPRMHLVIEIE